MKTSFCQFVTWLLPGLRKMLTSSISNTNWCHSVGESCNFMDSYILEFVLADVIANDFGQHGCVYGRCCCHVAIGLGNWFLFMADVIAMLPCFVVDVIPLVDVVAILYGVVMLLPPG